MVSVGALIMMKYPWPPQWGHFSRGMTHTTGVKAMTAAAAAPR